MVANRISTAARSRPTATSISRSMNVQPPKATSGPGTVIATTMNSTTETAAAASAT
jgi:hypothetical protein